MKSLYRLDNSPFDRFNVHVRRANRQRLRVHSTWKRPKKPKRVSPGVRTEWRFRRIWTEGKVKSGRYGLLNGRECLVKAGKQSSPRCGTKAVWNTSKRHDRKICIVPFRGSWGPMDGCSDKNVRLLFMTLRYLLRGYDPMLEHVYGIEFWEKESNSSEKTCNKCSAPWNYYLIELSKLGLYLFTLEWGYERL